MAWEIDRFAVLRTPFWTPWEAARVLIDESGNISVSEIGNGQQIPFVYCVSANYKNNRQYAVNQLITTFCNLATHTNYRVYAQDCTPYAYVQADLNSPKCGYLEPIDQPYTPPLPFGEASYGFYAYLNICDNKNIPINVRLYKRNYTGSAIKINSGGANPAIISYKNSDEDKLSPIRACEFHLTLVADGSFDLEQFYTKDEREFKVQVIKDGVTKFMGFLTASEASEEFAATPYDITLRATDGLGALKKIIYPIPISSKLNIKQNFIEMLCYCLAMTNLNLDISTICNLYESKMLNGIDDDPLKQASVNPLRASEKGKIFNCYQVLEKICLQFGAFIVQDNGVWHFIRQSELANIVLRKRVYNHQGFFIRSEQFHNKRVVTCNGSDISILDDSSTLRIGNAYKRAEVELDFGEMPFLLYNGDFEIYDGSNFAGWIKYGGIQVSRVEKQIKTTTGFIPSGNYALQFDEVANSSKYIEAAKIQVLGGDNMALSFNTSKTSDNNLGPTRGISTLKIRIIIGQWYLTNPSGFKEYIWVNQLSAATIRVNNFSDSIDTYLVSIDMPPAPISGEMTIQLYGFQIYSKTYTKVYIDNITITKSDKNKVNGRVLYVSQQDGFYTKTPDQISLLFGDYAGTNVIYNPTRDGVPTPEYNIEIKNDQYAIYTKDGSYSTGWYEFGGAISPIPIGLALARSIMKAYQQPFRFLESSFLGDNISYLDIFNVNLPGNTDFNNRIFALLSGDFDLVAGEVKNANYAEIFSKPGKTVDIIVPGKVGDPSPPITQNPNPTPVTTSKIFTTEFTNEFK